MMTKRKSNKSRKDITVFTSTSNEPYDRHRYKMKFGDTDKAIIFDDYEAMRSFWFQHSGMKRKCVVDILD